MLEPYEWKRSRTVLRREGASNRPDLVDYRPLVEGLGGEVIEISATSPNHINALDMESGYNDGDNPVVLKSEFLLSLCEQLVGAGKLSAKEKSIIDRCTAQVYREFIRNGYLGVVPTLQDFHAALLEQPEPEARDVALALELFTEGSLNTFAKYTNVDTNSRILCYDIRDLGKQLLPVGMLVVLDSVFNRIIRNRKLGKNTWLCRPLPLHTCCCPYSEAQRLRTGGTRYTPGNSRQTKQRFSIFSLLCLPFCQIFLQAQPFFIHLCGGLNANIPIMPYFLGNARDVGFISRVTVDKTVFVAVFLQPEIKIIGGSVDVHG